jgi:hypothetical protein
MQAVDEGLPAEAWKVGHIMHHYCNYANCWTHVSRRLDPMSCSQSQVQPAPQDISRFFKCEAAARFSSWHALISGLIQIIQDPVQIEAAPSAPIQSENVSALAEASILWHVLV